jgi:NADH/F420H2 dehydrogenase subunit C
MQKDLLKEKISVFRHEIEISDGKQYVEVTLQPGALLPFARFIREEELGFDFLVCLTGVDFKDKLGVIYHIASSAHKQMIVVKVFTPDREHPNIDSVSQVWSAAEFHEREVFDLFGISFNYHPDMRRLFMDEEWVGYPLRKDYVDENIIELK